jgi:pyruvate/2-oxoglutarate dehydrogenase complex dihydrolipoamide dehydrogenase (E3) component
MTHDLVIVGSDGERLPESIVVIGGNYVGLELGQLFAASVPG